MVDLVHIERIIAQMRAVMPPLFLGIKVHELTGGVASALPAASCVVCARADN